MPDMPPTPPALTAPGTRNRGKKNRLVIIAIVAVGAVFVAFSGATAWVLIAQANERPAIAEGPVAQPSRKGEPPAPTAEPEPEPAPEPEPVAQEPAPAPTNTGFDITNPNSITVLVNKQRPLNPITWQPNDLVWPNVPNSSGHPLRAEAAGALQEMYAAAAAAGAPFSMISGYRPYAMQESLFNSYAARDGVAAAERYSARPGHSEHQTGLAVDLDDGRGCALQSCFGDGGAGVWLRNNAHHYGFILRYHNGQEGVVGFLYEPWHFRYVGRDIAGAMMASGTINYESFLGQPGAPTY